MSSVMRFIISILVLFNLSCFAATLYVSPTGDDENPGTEAAPLATIEKARQEVRLLKNANPNQDIEVLFRGGTYRLAETVVFGLDDSAQDGYKVTYRAYPGEVPVFSSGVSISSWVQVPVPEEPEFLPPAASGNLWVADIPDELGLFKTMYDNYAQLPRARCDGFKPTVGPDDPGIHSFAYTDLHYPDGTVFRNWSNMQDVEILIRPRVLWSMNILPLASVDTDNKVAVTAVRAAYPMTTERYARFPDQSAWVENVIDALDQPGEWVVNTELEKIYYWPASGTPGPNIVAPCLKELFRVEGTEDFVNQAPVKNIVFDGLVFMHGDRDSWTVNEMTIQHGWESYDKANAMVRLNWAQNCVIQNCKFLNSGGTGLRLDFYCQNNKVINNTYARLGQTGIMLCGYGPGTKDLNKYNEIINNEIYNCGRQRWDASGIMVFQSGFNTISHNEIRNMPYNGMTVTGVGENFFTVWGMSQTEMFTTIRWDEVDLNPYDYSDYGENPPHEWVEPYLHARNNLIQYNDISYVMQVLGDGNGFYIRFAPKYNHIRRNYIHDITTDGSHGAFRCDGQQAYQYIYENIIADFVRYGMVIKEENYIENNIIANILHLGDPENPQDVEPVGYIRFSQEPAGAVFKRNIFYNSGPDIEFYSEQSGSYLENMVINNNLYWSKNNQSWGPDYLGQLQAKGLETDGVAVDPLLVDSDGKYYNLQPTSPAYSQIDFKEVNQNCMGLLSVADLNCDQDNDLLDFKILIHNWLDNFIEQPQAQYFGSDLVGHWKFDEGSGYVAMDSSENLNHGTIFSSSWTSGKYDTAINFDGTGYVSLPVQAFSGIDDQITICLWQYGNETVQPVDSCILGSKSADGLSLFNIHLPWGNGNVYWDAGNDGSSYDRINKYALEEFYEGKWNHWAFVKNVGSGQMKIYLNGDLWHSESGKSKPINYPPTVIAVGASRNLNLNYYGKIDDLRLYDRELNQTEITNVMNNSLNNTQREMVAWYKLDDRVQGIATDSSGKDNHGMITNSTYVEGKDGYAIDCDGTSYISVPTDDLSSLQNEITVSLWQYGELPESEIRYLIGSADDGSHLALTAALPLSNGNIMWRSDHTTAGSAAVLEPADPVEYSQVWTHWAFMKNSNTGVMKVYRNGTLWNMKTDAYSGFNSLDNLNIGASFAGVDGYKGKLDDIRIYNYELETQDIEALYTGKHSTVYNCPQNHQADINNDCFVDLFDLIEIATLWLYQFPF